MTTFEIISVVLAVITLTGAIITVYVKNMVEIAKLQVELTNFRRELNQQEIARLHTENINRDDHKQILEKIDQLIQRKC